MRDAIRLKRGTHAGEIKSSLSVGRTNRVFSIITGVALKVLEAYPPDVLEIGHNLPPGWAGGYFPSERRITVRPSVPPEHYGHPFVPGNIDLVGDAAKSETEAIQRNLIHEIAHSLLDRVPRDLRSYVKSRHRQFRQEAISVYAKKNSREFFAEAFAAYVFEREALLSHSQTVYSMVEHVLKESGLL
jgi:hypothetical protein